jgi:hypothetical protein
LANLGCPTSIMKIYTLTFLFFILAIKSFAQFDRINSDPLNLNASFAGSTGGHRLGNELNISQYNFFNSYNLHNKITYDGFFPKLKGGIGFSFSLGKFKTQEIHYIIPVNERNLTNTYQFNLVYAPKLTFSNEVTWSPSIQFGYLKLSNFYKQFYPKFENPLFYLSLGLLRNSKKVFYGIEYNHGINQQAQGVTRYFNFQTGIKLDKKSDNKLSSTLILGLRKSLYDEYIKRGILGGISIIPEWNIKVRSLLIILSTYEAGIGIKRPIWGVNFRSTYPFFGNTATGTYIRSPDKTYIESNLTYKVGFSYTFK